jgi:hypothetical protein
LNAKALSLSKLWQCTALHGVGNLNSGVAFHTPYQEEAISKYNSCICSDHISGSSVKQVQLFGTTPLIDSGNVLNVQCANNNCLIDKEAGQTGAFGRVQSALMERGEAKE